MYSIPWRKYLGTLEMRWYALLKFDASQEMRIIVPRFVRLFHVIRTDFQLREYINLLENNLKSHW